MLILWDISGQSRFYGVRDLYFRGASGGLLVFDLADPDALTSIRTWHSDFHRVVPDAAIVIVGNHVTPTNQRQIPPKVIAALKKEWQVPYIETSTTTGHGIETAFNTLATAALQRAKQRSSSTIL